MGKVGDGSLKFSFVFCFILSNKGKGNALYFSFLDICINNYFRKERKVKKERRKRKERRRS